MTNQSLYRKNVLMVIILCYSACTQVSSMPIEQVVEYKNARVIYKNRSIIVSTGRMERVWQWTGNGLLTTSIRNQVTGKEYAKGIGKFRCDWNLPGSLTDSSEAILDDVVISEDDDDGFTTKHLQVIAAISYPESNLKIQYVIWVYPGAPGIRTQLRIKAEEGFSPVAISGDDGKRIDSGHWISVPGARSEYLPLDFTIENARRYWGYYNNPGSRHDPAREMLEETLVTGYPLFLTEENNWASGLSIEYNNGNDGICVVKESPKCVNQQAHSTGGYYSGPEGLSVTGWGLDPSEIIKERYRECWAAWTIVWSQRNDGMQLALKQFDRVRYPVFPERDMFILSNTWGPADPDGARFTEEDYLLREIPALSKIGVEVIQIDDGWQKGEGRYNEAKGFSPKYKNGWKDIRNAADKYGLRFGLWVTAKFSTVEELNKNVDELGFISWKVDFDHLTNRTDYEERIKKYREVMKHAWMKTQFTLCPEYDDPRYGWYYCKEYGSIYFQNIQESLPAHLTMVPYQVLRQHWLMSKYFNTNKLQVMLQNPKRANPVRSDGPEHSHSYCFAMGVPFVPCFFQSAQNLDSFEQDELKTFISLYKRNREEIFNCYTFPIGDKPDNQSWSGFQMINEKNPAGNYILLFRELHNTESRKSVQLKFLSGKTIRISDIESDKSRQQKVPASGIIEFAITQPGNYLFLKYSVVE
jgi:hypothetical protein